MCGKYIDAKDRKIPISLSLPYATISEFDEVIAAFDSDRSKLMSALIKYCNSNKKNVRFINEIKSRLNNEK